MHNCRSIFAPALLVLMCWWPSAAVGEDSAAIVYTVLGDVLSPGQYSSESSLTVRDAAVSGRPVSDALRITVLREGQARTHWTRMVNLNGPNNSEDVVGGDVLVVESVDEGVQVQRNAAIRTSSGVTVVSLMDESVLAADILRGLGLRPENLPQLDIVTRFSGQRPVQNASPDSLIHHGDVLDLGGRGGASSVTLDLGRTGGLRMNITEWRGSSGTRTAPEYAAKVAQQQDLPPANRSYNEVGYGNDSPIRGDSREGDRRDSPAMVQDSFDPRSQRSYSGNSDPYSNREYSRRSDSQSDRRGEDYDRRPRYDELRYDDSRQPREYRDRIVSDGDYDRREPVYEDGRRGNDAYRSVDSRDYYREDRRSEYDRGRYLPASDGGSDRPQGIENYLNPRPSGFDEDGRQGGPPPIAQIPPAALTGDESLLRIPLPAFPQLPSESLQRPRRQQNGAPPVTMGAAISGELNTVPDRTVATATVPTEELVQEVPAAPRPASVAPVQPEAAVNENTTDQDTSASAEEQVAVVAQTPEDETAATAAAVTASEENIAPQSANSPSSLWNTMVILAFLITGGWLLVRAFQVAPANSEHSVAASLASAPRPKRDTVNAAQGVRGADPESLSARADLPTPVPQMSLPDQAATVERLATTPVESLPAQHAEVDRDAGARFYELPGERPVVAEFHGTIEKAPPVRPAVQQESVPVPPQASFESQFGARPSDSGLAATDWQQSRTIERLLNNEIPVTTRNVQLPDGVRIYGRPGKPEFARTDAAKSHREGPRHSSAFVAPTDQRASIDERLQRLVASVRDGR